MGYASREWTHIRRETMHQTERYSRFVRVMKRLLPLGASVLVLVVLAYLLRTGGPNELALQFDERRQIENDLTMINPRLIGTDDEGLPFTITAASAVQDGAEAKRVRLKDVNAELVLNDGSVLRLAAAEGLVNTEEQRMDVSGGISFTSDAGYAAQTTSASADLKTGIIRGEAPVQAQSESGRLTANGFVFDKINKQLRFEGDVHMLLDGGARRS